MRIAVVLGTAFIGLWFVVFACSMVGSIAGLPVRASPEPGRSALKAATSIPPTPTSSPTPKKLSPDEALVEAIKATGTLNILDWVVVTPSDKDPGKWDVGVQVLLMAPFGIGELQVEGALVDFTRVSEVAFTFGLPVERVYFGVTGDVVDNYGNSQAKNVAVLSLPQSTATQINWDGITHRDLWLISDKAMLSSAFIANLPDDMLVGVHTGSGATAGSAPGYRPGATTQPTPPVAFAAPMYAPAAAPVPSPMPTPTSTRPVATSTAVPTSTPAPTATEVPTPTPWLSPTPGPNATAPHVQMGETWESNGITITVLPSSPSSGYFDFVLDIYNRSSETLNFQYPTEAYVELSTGKQYRMWFCAGNCGPAYTPAVMADFGPGAYSLGMISCADRNSPLSSRSEFSVLLADSNVVYWDLVIPSFGPRVSNARWRTQVSH